MEAQGGGCRPLEALGCREEGQEGRREPEARPLGGGQEPGWNWKAKDKRLSVLRPGGTLEGLDPETEVRAGV